eukprot:m.193258 g.193258  ORF g.193258 m.193258 type:complete len:374 (+) comp18628_c0_seq2:151-1272(+)
MKSAFSVAEQKNKVLYVPTKSMGCDSHCSILEGNCESAQQTTPKESRNSGAGKGTTPSSAVLAAVSNRIPMRQRKESVGLVLGSMLTTATCIFSEIATYPWRVARYRAGANVSWSADGTRSFISDVLGVSWICGWRHGPRREGLLMWRGLGWSFLADSVELGVRWMLQTALVPPLPYAPSLSRALDTEFLWVNIVAATAAFPLDLAFMQSILSADVVNSTTEGMFSSIMTSIRFTHFGGPGQRMFLACILRRIVRQIGTAQVKRVEDEPDAGNELRQQYLPYAVFSTALNNAQYLDLFSDILLIAVDKKFATLCRKTLPGTFSVASIGWRSYVLPVVLLTGETIIKCCVIALGSAALWKMCTRTRHMKQQDEF